MAPQLDASWESMALRYRCTALHMLGEHERELRNSRRVVELYPDALRPRLCELRALAASGRVEDVSRIIDECVAIRSESGPPGWLARFD